MIRTLLFAVAALCGCSATAQNIRLITKTPGSYIFVIKAQTSEVTGERKIDTVYVGMDSCQYKKITDNLLVLVKKDHHKPKSFLLTEKLVKLYNKRLVLDPLEPLPEWKSNDSRIMIEAVNFDVSIKDFKTYYYDDYQQFLSNNLDRSSTMNEALKIRNSALSDDVNDFLVKLKYIDSSHVKKLNLNIYDQLELTLDVRSMSYIIFGEFYMIEMKSKVKFSAFYASQRAIEKEFTVRSNISRSTGTGNEKGVVLDALENVVLSILKDPDLSPNFVNLEEEVKKRMSASEEIIISNKPASASSVENAVNAVITVKLSDGHGSGCIISNDGYALTNFHVLGSDTANAEAIFNSGAKKKVTFIRGNPIYDLSLIKIDTVFSDPIRVSPKQAGIGSDVYAIGTPRDINLGQTVTRGIVSAKRVIQKKTFIQSDVSVNGGNSGGALTTKDGELIGIVNAKLIGVGVEGVSFAIPVSYIEEALHIKIRN